MSEPGYILVDAVAKACGSERAPSGQVLVAVDAVDLAYLGAAGVVEAARSDGLVLRKACDPAARRFGLATLVVVPPYGADDQSLWIVDGWTVIQTHGGGLDLKGANLAGAFLAGANLRGADLRDADLSRADLTKADLTGASLIGACLAGATLYSASLKNSDLSEADLSRADIRHADLRDAVCRRTAFRGADLWGTYMWRVDVSQAFVEGADLTRSDYLQEEVQC